MSKREGEGGQKVGELNFLFVKKQFRQRRKFLNLMKIEQKEDPQKFFV